MEKLREVTIEPYSAETNIQNPQWLMYEGLLSKEICEKIIELAKKLPTSQGTIFANNEISEMRKSQVRWINSDNSDFYSLFDLIYRIIREVNKGFRVNCNKFPSLQFTEYLGPGYKYDWHHDVNWSSEENDVRKISIVIQLSDPNTYSGGEFEFRNYENPDKDRLKSQGTVLCFLPYHEHRVKPIISGSRYSLVGWMDGPRWV